MTQQENTTDNEFVNLTNNNSVLTVLSTKKKYNLHTEVALEELFTDLKIEPEEIKKYLEHLREDMADHMIEEIGIHEFKRYNKLLKAIGYFFYCYFDKVDTNGQASN